MKNFVLPVIILIMCISTAYADLNDGMISYFPVTFGSSWTYDNGETVTVSDFHFDNDTLYLKIENFDNSGHVQLEITSGDIKSAGYSNPGYIMVAYYFAPSALMKFPITTGASWVNNLNSNGYPITINCQITNSSISVEAGGKNYENCVELTWSVYYPEGYDWEKWLIERKLYFEKNIGCIKRTDNWSDDSVTSIELVDYHIAEPTGITDSDGDGVPDQWDQCQNTPTGSIIYSDGCPAIKGDFNNNGKLDMGDTIGILQVLTGAASSGIKTAILQTGQF